MQTLQPKFITALEQEATNRGITMQELIRAVVVPDWLAMQEQLRIMREEATRRMAFLPQNVKPTGTDRRWPNG